VAKKTRRRGAPKQPPAEVGETLVETVAVEPPRRDPWYRDANKLTLIGLVVTVVVAVFGDDLASRVGDLFKRSPGLEQRVREAIEECRQDGFECKTSKSIVIANGTGELTAVGVDLIDKKVMSSPAGSAVLVFDKSGGLRWKSPIQSFTPGFGLTALETDVTNHLFVSFAVTNHSGIAWVVDPSVVPVQTFGTVGGSPLAVDGFEDPDFSGVRRLTAFREGWPANAQNPTTSRDVFVWDGKSYVFKGCELLGPSTSEGDRKVLEVRRPGTPQCTAPIGKYSVDLDGDRKPTADPP
jgi:hypothetical protein